MKVTVSVGGRFHAFEMAQQLHKHGALQRLITSYPAGRAARYGIPRDSIRSIIVKEFVERGWAKLPYSLARKFNFQFLAAEVYDHLASLYIQPADICVAWSSYGFHSLQKARRLGATTIVERGSSHMLFQTRILQEEYSALGVTPRVAHPAVIRKELAEYQESDYIAIPSGFVRRTFLEEGVPESKLLQIPYGVDLTAFRQLPREDDVFRVIFVGSVGLRKGVHYLLQAFSELNLPNSELLLIGSAGQEIEPYFQRFRGHFQWIPSQPQEALHTYLSQGSVFVLMSLEEGMGMVIPQAMACGLPVICTTNTGGEDIVREGVDGYVIPIRDVEALKERLCHLYEHPEQCRKMGQSAKQRVSSGFTWDDYGDRLMKIYQAVLSGR